MADGAVVAAVITAGGAFLTGGGAVLGTVLSRRSAQEAREAADQAADNAQALEERKVGYELMRVSIEVAHLDIKRLTAERAEDRQELARLRADMQACDDERRELADQVRRLSNGA